MKIKSDWMTIWVLFPFSCLIMLSKGKKLEVTSTMGVTQGREIFALACPGVMPSFDSVVWLLHEENTLVGAGVDYNHQKYRYHASTGELAIHNIQYQDAGIYRCIVTYGQGDKTMDSRRETKAVELLVSQPYQDLWEEQYKSNMIRGLIASGIAASLLTAACALYKYRWKQTNYSKYSEELQLVSGLDNLALELEHQRPRREGSMMSSRGMESPATSTAVVHISHI